MSNIQIYLRLPEWALEMLCCPICRNDLSFQNKIRCLNPDCKAVFPVINEIPVLLNPGKSEFSTDDFIKMKDTYYKHTRNGFLETLFKLAPKISVNIKAGENYTKFAKLLLRDSKTPRVLVLGGGIQGKGIDRLFNSPIELLETDVSFCPQTIAIVDAHYIPFKDNSFDGVVAQALLEHVADPYLCVKEIRRVLKQNGFVYAETAFMQQVHGGNFDFTRFTHLGHCRLFRHFRKIECGAVCGTGMVLAWAYERFLTSLIRSSTMQVMARLFARCTAFWLKYFDYLTIDNPETLHNAAAYYFLGQKSDKTLEDLVLVQSNEQ